MFCPGLCFSLARALCDEVGNPEMIVYCLGCTAALYNTCHLCDKFVFSLQSDQLHVLGFVDHVIQHLKENFVNGKNR